jgi:hypothetical protein
MMIVDKDCIFPKLATVPVGNGHERKIFQETLNTYAGVMAFCKLLEHRKRLAIKHCDERSIERDYFSDFVVKMANTKYLAATKSDSEVVWNENVGPRLALQYLGVNG